MIGITNSTDAASAILAIEGCGCDHDSEFAIAWLIILAIAILLWAGNRYFRIGRKTQMSKEESKGGGKKFLIAAILIAAAVLAVVVYFISRQSPQNAPNSNTTFEAGKGGTHGLPTLLDLGAKQCIPCKKMAPILEELRKEYEGRLEVIFIDVWQNPNAGEQYHIQLIPTQIFFDTNGGELFRHEGFFSKEDILRKWRELGLDFNTETRHPERR
jgi:thioredoxin 1